MSALSLKTLAAARADGLRQGITSVCSAHPLVIEAALRQGLAHDANVVIEATCNQVNHRGGYTGMTPAMFRDFVEDIARTTGFPMERVLLGGDHLGPNPWKHLPPADAMAEATQMVSDYARAGFSKMHLDTSMGCAGEPVALGDAVTAQRAAILAKAAEAAAAECGMAPPEYIVGTEVPIPGGALEVIEELEVTRPEAAVETLVAHRLAFEAQGLSDAFARVVAIVVQPGVEFGNENVIVYDPPAAAALSAVLDTTPGIVFEAHSTDYQPTPALTALVEDGFAILKVGPGVTFALREALYGLDHIATFLYGRTDASLSAAMETLMMRAPENWQSHYHGSEAAQRLNRHFSYSDRIRYYWTHPDAVTAVQTLLDRLGDRPIPETLISQYLATLYPKVAAGEVRPVARDLAIASVQRLLAEYSAATAQRTGHAPSPAQSN